LPSFYFLEAEDGIRDFHVTVVQTCALPILAVRLAARVREEGGDLLQALEEARQRDPQLDQVAAALTPEERALPREPLRYQGRAEAPARAPVARRRARGAQCAIAPWPEDGWASAAG